MLPMLAAFLAVSCDAAVLTRVPAPVATRVVPAMATGLRAVPSPNAALAVSAASLSPSLPPLPPVALAPAPSPLAAPADAPKAGAALAARRRGRDVTAEYQAAFDAGGGLDEEALARLREHRVLFVGGFMSNKIRAARALDPLQLTYVGEYFDQSIVWLRRRGVSAERVELQTESAPEHNARRIAAALRASDKPVIVVSHSKGGLDMLDALLTHPELRRKVAGWAPQQAPFFGSPIADETLASSLRSGLADWALWALGGSGPTVSSLGTRERAAYMRRHAEQIRAITASIPILAFASWMEPRFRLWDTVMRATRDRLAARGHKNDGLVPVKSAFLPGAERVSVEGVDHLHPVSGSFRLPFDQVRHTRALLALLLRRGAARP